MSTDTELADVGQKKPRPPARGVRVVRWLVYAQALAALCTAAHRIEYVVLLRGWGRYCGAWINDEGFFQFVSGLGALSMLVFPPLIVVVGWLYDVPARAFRPAVAATLVLACFQIWTGWLPAVQ